MNWILLITIVSYNGLATTSAVDFPSRTSCLTAANAYVQQVSAVKKPGGGGNIEVRALCVARGYAK